MKNANDSFEIVNLLRVTSSASDQLQSSLESFTKPGLIRPRFSIKTLSGIALDAANHQHHDVIRKATAAFESSYHEPLRLGSAIAARRMGDGALKLLLATENHSKLAEILKTIRKDYFPNEITLADDEDERFDLYVRIDGSRAISQDQLKAPGLALRSQLSSEANHLLSITPNGIIGLNEMRTIKRSFDIDDTA